MDTLCINNNLGALLEKLDREAQYRQERVSDMQAHKEKLEQLTAQLADIQHTAAIIHPSKHDAQLQAALDAAYAEAAKQFPGGFTPAPLPTEEEMDGIMQFLYTLVAHHGVGGLCRVSLFDEKGHLRKGLPACFGHFAEWFSGWEDAIAKCAVALPGTAKKGAYHMNAQGAVWITHLMDTWNTRHTQSRMESGEFGLVIKYVAKK